MTSYANASSEMSQNDNDDDNNDDNNTRRNRKTQALSALLSATALGVFLEGCGGGDIPAPTPPPTPPAPNLGVLGSASNPFVGTAEAKVFVGSVGADWVSYAGSLGAGVKVDLLTPTDNLGWADGDTLTGIRNIIGTPQGDTLIGNGGENTLRGGLGGDALNGNEGSDTVSYSSSSLGVRVDLSLTGTDAQVDFTTEVGFAENQNEAVGDTLSNIENIDGSAQPDWLMGDSGNNIIRGGGGGDTISGGAGDDRLEGGAGADTYIFRVGDGTDIITDALGDTMTLRFIGDYADTDFAADRTDGPLFAIEGNNLVFTFVKDDITDKVTIEDAYGTGVALRYTIKVEYGTAADSLTKIAAADGYWSGLEAPTGDGSESNPYEATAGNDVITGSGLGSTGANWVSYAGSAGVTIDLSDDDDTAAASRGADGDTLKNIQNLIGTDETDGLVGNKEANIFHGGGGSDAILGHGGEDTLYGGAGSDEIRGGDGDDTIYGGAGDDNSIGLYGDAGADTIYGGAGVDNLYGNDGADTLDGGTGDDRIYGHADEDTYIFRVGDGTDTITDIAGETMTLRFIGSYADTDFAADRTGGPLFARDGNNLVISIDKADDGITDQVTINDAYDDDGNLLYTINVQYGTEGSLNEVAAADAYWDSEGSEGNPFVATAEANAFTGSGLGSGDANWVSYANALGTGSIIITLSDDPATAAAVDGAATGDTLIGIQNIIGTAKADSLTGNKEANTLRGGAGNDQSLRGGAGDDTLDGGTGDDFLTGQADEDTYIFRVGDSSGTDGDTISYDEPGDTMILRFIGAYVEGDFVAASDNFDRVDNNLVITLDTDKITILNAYNDDSTIGTGNSAFTIEVEYGIEGSDPFNDVTLANSFWHALTA